MSAQNSNLSETSYKYDLVSALTQDALNSNLKTLINDVGQNAAPLVEYYKYTDSSRANGTVPMTDEEVQEMTDGNDIFAIKAGTTNETATSEEKKLVLKMAEMGFAYAFKAEIGLPAGISPKDMPDIISLNINSDYSSGVNTAQTVQYNLYFKSFILIELVTSFLSWTIKKKSQPDDAPWISQWLVDLSLQVNQHTEYQSLPEDIKSRLKEYIYTDVYNLDPTTMFSLQQLLLDLNQPEMISGFNPTVVGLEPTDPICIDINAFIQNYWLPLVDSGGITFVSSVTPEGTDYPASSIVPTDLNFVVSPCSDGTKGLYTLNYLVETNQNSMPESIVPFPWNWVENEAKNDIQGIMSVRRDVFIDFLNKALAPCLSPLCGTVDVQMEEGNQFGQPTINVYLYENNPATSYKEQTTGPCLTFSYHSEDEESDTHLGVTFNTTFGVYLNVNSSITLLGNTINCQTECDISYRSIEGGLLGSDVTRYELAKVNNTTFTLDAVGVSDASGNSKAGLLSVSSTSSTEDLRQTDDSGAPYYAGDNSIWSEILTGGNIKDFEAQVADVATQLDTLMDGYVKAIQEIVNDALGFVFPGAQTYFFANPAFSDHFDLTVQVAFQSPS